MSFAEHLVKFHQLGKIVLLEEKKLGSHVIFQMNSTLISFSILSLSKDQHGLSYSQPSGSAGSTLMGSTN